MHAKYTGYMLDETFSGEKMTFFINKINNNLNSFYWQNTFLTLKRLGVSI